MSEPPSASGEPDLDLAVTRLDQLALHDIEDGLRACCGSRRFVVEMAKRRPWGSGARLFEAAAAVATTLAREDWLEAFAHHPRIGDVQALRVRLAQAKSQHWSRGEQAGVDEADPQLLERLAAGNLRYEGQFGYLYIVCARGKSVAQMVDLLEARLGHDPETELLVAAREQQAITTLRLEKWLRESAEAPRPSEENP